MGLFQSIYRFRNSKFSIIREINFYKKIYLIGQGFIGAKLIFPKYLFGGYIEAFKVKSDFSTYFSKGTRKPKNISCVIILSFFLIDQF
jgi:hypothetical protein